MTEQERQAALDALDRMAAMLLDDKDNVYKVDEEDIIRAALSLPAVPVIEVSAEKMREFKDSLDKPASPKPMLRALLNDVPVIPGLDRVNEVELIDELSSEEQAAALKAACAYAALPKMQKVDLDEMILQLPYDEIEQRYINCYLSNERVRGYNVALDDIKSKYGELYAEVR